MDDCKIPHSFNTPEELIAGLAKGEMIVLVDDEDRENEGDLVMAAEKITAESINFMAKHARGLICLTLTPERCRRLHLPQMVNDNRAPQATSFTLSIEAAQGVSTGISAADRAHTIKVAVAPNATADDIVQPGHIFPVRAQPGGVLNRAGHTEAGCDLARLADLEAAAVIVEIMNEDGSMARRPDLEIFSRHHNLKIGTIADLIHYRVMHEKTVSMVYRRQVHTSSGEFELFAYRDTVNSDTHLALVKGEISPDEATLVRVHHSNALHDLLGIENFGSRWSLAASMNKIAEAGSGVLILLGTREPSQSLLDNVRALDPGDSASQRQTPQDRKNIGVGSQILRDLGVGKILLLGALTRYHSLSGFGLEVVEFIN